MVESEFSDSFLLHSPKLGACTVALYLLLFWLRSRFGECILIHLRQDRAEAISRAAEQRVELMRALAAVFRFIQDYKYVAKYDAAETFFWLGTLLLY